MCVPAVREACAAGGIGVVPLPDAGGCARAERWAAASWNVDAFAASAGGAADADALGEVAAATAVVSHARAARARALDRAPRLERVGDGRDAFTAFVDRDAALVAGASDEAEALVIDFRGIAALEAAAAEARLALAARGRTISELRIVVRLAVVAAATASTAWELADELPLDARARENAVVGSHAAVAAVLSTLAGHGAVDAIDVSPVLGAGATTERALAAVSREVLPRVEAGGAALAVRVPQGAGMRAALGLPAEAAPRTGATVPFAAFETEIPTGF